MTIKIDYNTFSFACQIECDDKTIQSNLEQSITDNDGKRIIDWFEKFINRVKEESNNDTFSIEINGCDTYEKIFIESVLEKENGVIDKKEIEYISDRVIEQRYNAIDDFLNYSLTSKEAIIKSAIEINKPRIKFLRSNKVEVPVVATMSSGKSTLLNALIGMDLLPEDSETTTATSCNIKINNSLKSFKAHAINDNAIFAESVTNISGFIEEWNSNANNEEHSKIKLFLEGPVTGFNSSNLELNFIDTPGPNSAKHENHREKTYDYLKDNQSLPIVLYVIDPEKMDSKDDGNTLKEISSVFKNNKQNLDRIIFIINKIDREDPENKPYSEVLLSVRNFLKKHEIYNPKIFGVSSRYAKFAQLKESLKRNDKNELETTLRYKFTPQLEDNYKGYQLLEYSPLTENQKKQLLEKITESVLDADLVYSGLAAIKLYIEDYITNHHKKNQYKDLMSIANNVFDEIKSTIDLEKEKLEEKTVDEQKKIEARKKNEEEELKIKKVEALHKIANVKINKKFIQDATKKADYSFDRLKAKSTRNKLSPTEAKRLVEWANNIISDLEVSIKTDLVSKINDESQNYLRRLKTEVGNKFNLKKQSIEQKSFNSQLLNKINVLDIRSIDAYKTTVKEQKKREVEKKVRSGNFFKRLFGIKETKIVLESYTVSTTATNISKFYNDKIVPKIKEFNALIKKCDSESEKIFQEYNIAFQDLVKSSFEESLNSVYKNSDNELARNEEEIKKELLKLNGISNNISKYKIK